MIYFRSLPQNITQTPTVKHVIGVDFLNRTAPPQVYFDFC